MNFFKKLFDFLFHKNHTLSKKVYTFGAVLITVVSVSIFFLGANDYGSSAYGEEQSSENKEIVVNHDDVELEEITVTEESEALPIKYDKDFVRLSIHRVVANLSSTIFPETVELVKQPMRSEDVEIELSTSSYNSEVELSPHVIDYDIPEEGVIKANLAEVVTRKPVVLSDADYQSLLRIVEAEVGTEEFDSRVIIANVIINRMYHAYYPNTIEEVVFQNDGKVYQFSPILDGRYHTVVVSEMTRNAVDLALTGYDNSGGALAFVNRSLTSDRIMDWFDDSLDFVMQYDDVEFFTFEIK